MADEALQCQGCGATLTSPDAVCARCEAELDAEPPPGRYICPHCQGRFAALTPVPWPPRQPWWRPTTMRLQCPHCEAPLRDRHAVQLPGWLFVGALGAIVAVQLFATGWLRLALGFPLLAALYGPLIRAGWKIHKDSDNPHRFVAGSLRFWAQGNEKLAHSVERLRSRPGHPPR